jgi:acyl-CoA thioesterase
VRSGAMPHDAAMQSLHSVLTALVEMDGVFSIEALQAWSQGRTLYGGITAALCAEAAARAIPDLPPLRAAQLAFVGPASGRVHFTPNVLRRGRSATFVGVDATGEAGPAARALFLYASERDSEVAHDITAMPDAPPPESCPPLFPEGAVRPTFFQNFEVCFVRGTPPVTRAARPTFDLWVRHRDATGVDPLIALLALADCPPPAALAAFSKMAPISTMTWTIDLFHPIPASGWHLLRSTSEQAAHGLSLQAMELWDTDGRRLAVGRQTVALFG